MSEKVILVTGGSSGIGRAIAEHLAALGHMVYGTSRSVKPGEMRDGVHMLQLDVTDESSIQTALARVIEASGRLDVVINNAGLGMAGPLECTTNQEVQEIFETNVYGVLNVCRHAIPLMRAQPSSYLINITSIAGKIALPYRGIYAASKHAVEGFTESLSMELKPFGIRVCLIEPGDFKTNINATRRVAGQVDLEHYPQFPQVLEQIVAEVEYALDPSLIAQKVERILNTSHPKLRYVVGRPMQRFAIHLKYWLGGRRFERMLRKHYQLD